MDLYKHQKEAVDKLSSGKILYGGVGTGKSIVAAAYYIKSQAPKDVYVITTAKKRDDLDWEKEFVRYGVYKSIDATVAGILTVDSWNNITKYKDIKNAFFVFDEQKLVGSGVWVDIFLEIAKHNEWILLSATPGDTWLDYIPVFLANGFYNNRTEFKREHVIYKTYSKFPKVDRYAGVKKLERLRDQLLVEMPYLKHTERIHKDILVEFDRELFDKVVKKRWHVYEERPLRDVAELFLVMRKVVNSDSSRLSAVRSLLKSHPRLIVFYNFNYELEELRSLSEENLVAEWKIQENQEKLNRPSEREKTGGSSGQITVTAEELGVTSTIRPTQESFALAEWNGHKHEPIPETDRWVYLVQYNAGAEGWNCIKTDAMVFYSQTYSYKILEQSCGRIDRLNTPFEKLYYYTLKSKSTIDKAISRALEAKKDFNERRFVRLF